MQAMDTRRQRWPFLLQLGGKVGKFRPGLLGQLQIGQAERVFFQRDKMQTLAALRVIAPGLSGGKKIQPKTKAGFEDDKAVLALPAFRQAIAPEKNMAGLVGCAISRVIHVVVGEGKRITVARKFQASRLEFFH